MPRNHDGTTLLNDALDAHGGAGKLRREDRIRAEFQHRGELWRIKRKAWPQASGRAEVDLDDTSISQRFADRGGASSFFEPDHVAIYCKGGELDQNIFKPRRWFAGHTIATPWWDLQSVYFGGCLIWNTLCLPFALARADVLAEELSGCEVDGQWLRRLKITFPQHIAMLSQTQTLHLRADGLVHSIAFDLEMAGDVPCLMSVGTYESVEGLAVPVSFALSERQDFPYNANASLLSARYRNPELRDRSENPRLGRPLAKAAECRLVASDAR